MPRGRKSSNDTTMLQMALVGYQHEKTKIDGKIREIEALLGGKKAAAAPAAGEAKVAGPRRTLSPAARKRIAAAQKKRWAEHRKKLAGATE